jgi:hypothetical protein
MRFGPNPSKIMEIARVAKVGHRCDAVDCSEHSAVIKNRAGCQKGTKMKSKVLTPMFAWAIALGMILSLSTGGPTVSASSERNGQLHVTKECSQNTGMPGTFCTITSSNLPEITVGAKVFYDQQAGIPAGMLDSNVVLHVGTGDWAVGRCTLDGSTGRGLCTFSDGVGPFTGFRARVDVAPSGGPNFRWDGTYSFKSQPPR